MSRGEGPALTGVVSGVPALACLPLSASPAAYGIHAAPIGMGLVAGGLGYPVTFLVTAAIVLAALTLARGKASR